MKPSQPKETKEQKQQRKAAQADNLRAIQDSLRLRTASYRRQMSPRVSLVTRRPAAGLSIAS